MVKNRQLKKSELIEILSMASTSKERNKAAKLLKTFDPVPHKESDNQFELKDIKIKKYGLLQAFVCWRCDKVKQTNIKVHWNIADGIKYICNTCYSNLCSLRDLERVRKDNNAYFNSTKK
ncbi:hypothetical protein IE077_002134 [Cardiosporidium cionae]|uniref:Uncharacterized protein n=1 Tax=Cardiosporidium cionae TaxID=476202 RepID=A0ABQ7J4N8_9APIC|nr:hypothetical protein IE077_002134 [Cardiosporidium cionae]|eukprot:KAF8818154.1 hypothetical protein IE077_002134 [Cardiosporidium cionae]